MSANAVTILAKSSVCAKAAWGSVILFTALAAFAGQHPDPAARTPSKPFRISGNEYTDLRELWQWEDKRKQFGINAAGPRPPSKFFYLSGYVVDNANGWAQLTTPTVLDTGVREIVNVYLKSPAPVPKHRTNCYAILVSTVPTQSQFRRSGFDLYFDAAQPAGVEEVRARFTAPPAKPKTAEEISAEKDRVLRYQLSQASNGSPSFQYEVGRRYLVGDGVETNLALARHWLTSAATNGNPAASNLLTRVQ